MTSIQAASEREEVNLRDLEARATPGPWRSWIDDYEAGTMFISIAGGPDGPKAPDVDSLYIGQLEVPDAALIAALRNAAPFLLDVVEAAHEVVRFYGTDRTWSLAFRTLLGSRIGDLARALDSHLSAARRNPK